MIELDGDRLRIAGGPVPLQGRLRVPGDKSISHRALLLAALADGTSLITGLSDGDDVARTRHAVVALGAGVDAVTVTEGADASGAVGELEGPGAPLEWRVEGCDGELAEPADVVDVGNSGTAIRLLAGVAASQPFLTVLTGDASIRRRPMDRVTVPLRLMGASIDGRDGGHRAPLVLRGGSLSGIDYETPVASAQVKSAILLAGLAASGETVVREPRPSRAHTEEMLERAGARIDADPAAGTVRLQPGRLNAVDWAVPGDPSQAAFWVCAAAAIPDSDVEIEGLYLGRSRAGFLDVLDRMGADLDVDVAAGRVRVRGRRLSGTEVAAGEIPGLIDEVPALAVAAALAQGATRFAEVGELRVKESNRVSALAVELSRFGVDVAEDGDNLVVRGAKALHGAACEAHGDHRIAMAAAVAGAAAEGETSVSGFDAVATSYPGFVEHLREVTGR